MRRKHGTASPSISEETKRNIYFYHHSIEDHIASLAEQAGDKNLVAPITAELVRLLEAKTLWESFRHSQSLPEMRTQRNRDRTGGWAGSAPRALAADVFSPASGHRPLTAKARKAISNAQHKRWAAYHDRKDANRARWRKSKQGRRRVADPNLTAAGKPRKRILTPAQLAAMRANAVKARAANRKKKHPPMSAEQRAKISASMKAAFASRKAAGAA